MSEDWGWYEYKTRMVNGNEYEAFTSFFRMGTALDSALRRATERSKINKGDLESIHVFGVEG